MSSGTKILLTLVALFVGVLVLYYGFIMPSPESSAGARATSDPALGMAAANGAGTKRTPVKPAAPKPEQVQKQEPREIEMGRAVTPKPTSTPAHTPTRTAGAGTGVDHLPAARLSQQPVRSVAKGVVPVRVPDSKPAAPAAKAARPVYSTYTVVNGDSLSSIAARWFGDATKWNLIAAVNPGMSPDVLKLGQRLRLPPKDAAPKPPAAGSGSHVIRSGETLSGIAKAHYGDTSKWRAIWDANRAAIGADPDDLEVGTKLRIP